MFKLLLKPLTLLSLPALHRIGKLIGYIMYALMPESKKNIKENIRQSGLLASNQDINSFIKSNLLESGKSYLESLAIWQKKDNTTLKYMEAFDNIDITLENNNKVKGEYAYYDAKKNTISVEDKVSLTSESGTIKACRIIIDSLTLSNFLYLH
jgi:uncharacterized protein (DUF2235 family)